MDKRSRDTSSLRKARQFLHCVVLEQQAATEELKASNRELERLLHEVLSTRSDLRPVGSTDVEEEDPGRPVRPEAPELRVAELKREVHTVLEQGAAAIRESMRLRRQSQRIRSALQNGAAKSPPAVNTLSKREHQVLTLIVAGKSSKEIAAELGISFKTAVTHRASIMSKMDVHEIASVVREAIRRGLV